MTNNKSKKILIRTPRKSNWQWLINNAKEKFKQPKY